MHELTLASDRNAWTRLLEQLLSALVLAPFVTHWGKRAAPFVMGDWRYLHPLDEEDQRIVYLDALVRDGDITPEEAVRLFEDPTRPLTGVDFGLVYERDGNAYLEYDIGSRPNQETFKLLYDNRLGLLVKDGGSVCFELVGPEFWDTYHELESSLELLDAPYRFHQTIVQVCFDDEAYFSHTWGSYDRIDELLLELCDYDEEAYLATFGPEEDEDGDVAYPDPPFEVFRDNPYKGGGFSCTN